MKGRGMKKVRKRGTCTEERLLHEEGSRERGMVQVNGEDGIGMHDLLGHLEANGDLQTESHG